jgi:hypothetical protein
MINLLYIPLSFISAVLGRAGGMDKSPEALPRWIPVWLRQSWVRDWLCPLCAYILLFTGFNVNLIWWLVTYGFTGLALTTYINTNGKHNFWLSGFVVGLAGLFLGFLGVSWQLLLLRAFLVAIVWGLINLYCNNRKVPDGTEELSRYGWFTLTMAIIGG